MKLCGIDLGTTSISGVLFDIDSDEVIWSGSAPSGAEISGTEPWENLQDPGRILDRAVDMLEQMEAGGARADAVCVTGQMHGVLYLDGNGKPLSPLYTWLDQRGAQQAGEAETFADRASALAKTTLSTGFGMVTHYYNLTQGLVPKGAARICTIMDYVAMKLAGESEPVTDPSNAAGMGLYIPGADGFDADALSRLGVDRSMLPAVARGKELLRGEPGKPVIAGSVGDNQASFLGAVQKPESSLLLNIGTSGQISLYSESPDRVPGLDTRPFPEGYLIVGATLSGGKSVALLADFYREVMEVFGAAPPDDLYARMNRIVLECEKREEGPAVDTRFAGTRGDSHIAGGSIENITLTNFTPARLTAGFMEGIARELHSLFSRYPEKIRSSHPVLVGSGNTVRNNPAVQLQIRRVFGTDSLLVPRYAEEAAFGAALLASLRTGYTPDLRETMSHVLYE
ncbi:sedoheptulokinase [Salinispira pacifica]